MAAHALPFLVRQFWQIVSAVFPACCGRIWRLIMRIMTASTKTVIFATGDIFSTVSAADNFLPNILMAVGALLKPEKFFQVLIDICRVRMVIPFTDSFMAILTG